MVKQKGILPQRSKYCQAVFWFVGNVIRGPKSYNPNNVKFSLRLIEKKSMETPQIINIHQLLKGHALFDVRAKQRVAAAAQSVPQLAAKGVGTACLVMHHLSCRESIIQRRFNASRNYGSRNQ